MQVILLIIAALVVLGLAASILYWAFRGARYVGMGMFAVVAGIPIVVGKCTHAVARAARTSWIASPLLVLASGLACIGYLSDGHYVLAATSSVTALLAGSVAVSRLSSVRSTRQLRWQAALRLQHVKYDMVSHAAAWITCTAALVAVLARSTAPAHAWLYGMAAAYWLGASGAQLFTLVRHTQLAAMAKQLERHVRQRRGMPLDALIAQMRARYTLLDGEVPRLVREHVAFASLDGRLVEVELNGRRRLFCAVAYQGSAKALGAAFIEGVRYPEEALAPLMRTHLGLDYQDGLDLVTHHMRLGEMYQFEDVRAFVPYPGSEHVRCCISCGAARWQPDAAANDDPRPWYCGKICEQTDRACLDIHHQEPASFVNDAISNGFALVGGTDAWVANHKVFAAGGQGHGFAAEKANTYLDRLLGRSASVVGDNNAKGGPDRLVNGEFRQTKYCHSAGKSVNQAFDNKGSGNYAYLNADGSVMKLEVPPEQHERAVKLMAEKIRQGKVPGVSDPAAASELVTKGQVTYDQARNIVRFGRIEALALDVAEGAVVSLGAASVSFCVSAALIYLRNGDSKAALQAAAWQAGKVGASTMVSYVAVQQLHRLAPVQALLKTINVSGFPPTLRDMLIKGMGQKSDNALKHALGGAAVTSVVAIGVATAPDIYRVIRRQVTAAQLKRTVVAATAGTVGAFVGSVAGGMAGAPAGPLGVFIGRTGGGILGGLAGTLGTEWFFAEEREREQVLANERFRAHLSYLALTFGLTEDEVQVVVRNFLQLSSKHTQQRILSGFYEGRAYLNSILKPVVVGVVKQRDYLRLDPATIASFVMPEPESLAQPRAAAVPA